MSVLQIIPGKRTTDIGFSKNQETERSIDEEGEYRWNVRI